jgi:hypothetical protein
MERYELVIEDTLNSYILDKKENTIVALCSTKRPDLGFEKLKELVSKANRDDEKKTCGNCEYVVLDSDKEPCAYCKHIGIDYWKAKK